LFVQAAELVHPSAKPVHALGKEQLIAPVSWMHGTSGEVHVMRPTPASPSPDAAASPPPPPPSEDACPSSGAVPSPGSASGVPGPGPVEDDELQADSTTRPTGTTEAASAARAMNERRIFKDLSRRATPHT
jgi:hypothetical protein